MANNPYVNKVQLADGTSLIDISSDTVTADKLMQGYTAHDRTGALITGTATGGGGSVTQDQDGFIVLPPDGGGGGGSTGLVYETGTWTPSVDIADTMIGFANTHTVAPTLVMVCDSDVSARDVNSNAMLVIGNAYEFLGFALTQSETNRYGMAGLQYTSSSGFTGSSVNITSLSSYGSWLTSSGFRAYCGSTSRYWRAGRTYKWIAVWAPTT